MKPQNTLNTQKDFLFKNESYLIRGAAFEVYRAQLHNYLKTTGLQLGFIINFGHYPKATIERIVK
ncbi:GxxExxY protein [Desulfobotulus pelophilus]|uniref:GxxExxY protein n=1 Tax=Desulfobotulus pelophilus TaxID=2823377 RepID=UPI0034A38DFA